MVEREHLLAAAGLRDELGVLSLYLDLTDPLDEERSFLELRHGLEQVERELAGEGPRLRRRALAERRAQLGRELEGARIGGAGRSHALFAGLSGGEPVRTETSRSLPTCAALDERAHVRPLLVARQLEAPAGVAVVERERLRLFEWTPDAMVELAERDLPRASDRERPLLGPAHAHPRGVPHAAPGFRAGQQRDLYEHHLVAELERELGDAAAAVSAEAARRGWEELVVSGDETASLLEPAPQEGGEPSRVLRDHRLLGWLSAGRLAHELEPVVLGGRSLRRRALAAHVRDEALGGRRGAVGVRAALAALAEGRVATLLLAAGARLEPPAAPGAEAGAAGGDVAEKLIARALATDADVVVLLEGEEEALRPEAVGALLRW